MRNTCALREGFCDDELSFFWDATGPGSLQFHACLLWSTYYGSPVWFSSGVWEEVTLSGVKSHREKDMGGTAMSRVNKVVIKHTEPREAHQKKSSIEPVGTGEPQQKGDVSSEPWKTGGVV